MAFNWWLYKQIVTCWYNGILLTPNKCHNTDEPPMHYSKSKQPDSKATYYCMIPYAQSHFYDILEKGKTNRDRRQISSGCQGLEVGERNDYKGPQGNSGGWWNCSVFWPWWWLHDYAFFKISQNSTLKTIKQFMVKKDMKQIWQNVEIWQSYVIDVQVFIIFSIHFCMSRVFPNKKLDF